MNSEKVHQGRNVRRFREMRELKQDALAKQLGSDWNQQKVSMLEQKETIDLALLEQLSEILNMPVDAFRKLDDEQAVNVIANSFTDSFNESTNAFAYNNNCTFNPFDQWVQAMEENKKLYERLLENEREKTQLLKEVLDKLK